MAEFLRDWVPDALKILSITTSVISLIALAVAIRGVVIARREAYQTSRKDFDNLRKRVQEELKKD
jgi:Holliday junction resolvase RusA-like endonuclease